MYASRNLNLNVIKSNCGKKFNHMPVNFLVDTSATDGVVHE